MKKLCTKEEFMEMIEALMDVMFIAGEEAAETAGEPVDAVSALRNALIEDGVATAEDLETSPCFGYVSRTKLLIGADGNVYDPDEDEEETK